MIFVLINESHISTLLLKLLKIIFPPLSIETNSDFRIAMQVIGVICNPNCWNIIRGKSMATETQSRISSWERTLYSCQIVGISTKMLEVMANKISDFVFQNSVLDFSLYRSEKL